MARARRDYHYKTALSLVRRYELIAVEALNVRGLQRGMLAKSISDAGWSQFLAILADKAAEAGRIVVAVDPHGTSQVCSNCGRVPETRKLLGQRSHECHACGYVAHRDVNAARNILWLGLMAAGRADPSASRPASEAAA